ncbi:hypothetical protein J1614_003094 [Plenodomus biglobosus]|nr:hypothetical protein J1614_003094 [Plenodomus biglobosus]
MEGPALPWDVATAPLDECLARAWKLVPEWAQLDTDEYRRWDLHVSYSVREALENGYFGRSRRFLKQSRRLYEVWRTMRLWGEGRLPVELADVIVRDICFAEDLPVGDLRAVFLPKEAKVKMGGDVDPSGKVSDRAQSLNMH